MIKVGDKVRIKNFDKRPEHWNVYGGMDKWMGRIVTISGINGIYLRIKEDECEHNGGWRWRQSDFEKVEDKPMTRDDLKNGMICVLRNGGKYIWLVDALVRIKTWCSGTKSDLTGETEQFDIMAVYNPVGYIIKDMLNHDYSQETPIWQRVEPRKMTVKEIEQELGYTVEIVR